MRNKHYVQKQSATHSIPFISVWKERSWPDTSEWWKCLAPQTKQGKPAPEGGWEARWWELYTFLCTADCLVCTGFYFQVNKKRHETTTCRELAFSFVPFWKDILQAPYVTPGVWASFLIFLAPCYSGTLEVSMWQEAIREKKQRTVDRWRRSSLAVCKDLGIFFLMPRATWSTEFFGVFTFAALQTKSQQAQSRRASDQGQCRFIETLPVYRGRYLCFSPPARWGLLDFIRAVLLLLLFSSSASSSSSFSSTISASNSTSTSALPTLRQALRQRPHAVGTAGPQPGTFWAQWAPLDLNGQIECQKICQIECQIDCQIECQKICQIKCQKICQIECQKIWCQIECQKICQIGCQEICQIECQKRLCWAILRLILGHKRLVLLASV